MRRFNKKASLEISINAIVILILAITILGLGLGFIKSQFGSLQKQFGKVSQGVESQIIDDIEKSGALLTFTTLTFDNVKAGTKNDFFFGTKSTETSRDTCFYIQFICENAIGASCPDGSRAAAMDVAGTTSVKSGWNWFNTLQGSQVEPGSVKVLPGLLQASNAQTATYNGKVIVWKHFIGTDATKLEYINCLSSEIKIWPKVRKKDGTNIPTIDGSNSGETREVQLHDSKEFFVVLV